MKRYRVCQVDNLGQPIEMIARHCRSRAHAERIKDRVTARPSRSHQIILVIECNESDFHFYNDDHTEDELVAECGYFNAHRSLKASTPSQS